jgi:hypothetical protein
MITGGELATDLEAELVSARKQIADADAERLTLESALVDALGCLQFYASDRNWIPEGGGFVHPMPAREDAGKRARVTLNRIFDRIEAVRVQALREPPLKAPPEDGAHGCDTCEEP